MKIMLFRGGQRGEIARTPGEYPKAELEELLEGETEMTPISRRLTLVTRRDGEEKQLPIRFALHRLGREPEPIAGDCAVIATGADGCLRDIVVRDIPEAEAFVRAIR